MLDTRVSVFQAVIVATESTLTESTWITSGEACDRLRVRSQTLYAYVSRGLLHPRKDGRRSLFRVAELDALAASARRRTRDGRLEVLIDTDLTLIDPDGHLYYRGVDLATIAGHWSFERTATWLWTGLDDHRPHHWPEVTGAPTAGERPATRVRAAAALLAATHHPLAPHPDAASTVGPLLIATLVAALPPLGHATGEGHIAARLWPRLSPLVATPARIRTLDAALVLLADHELAPSTVAARVAASTSSPPLDTVVAALAAHTGSRHAGACSTIEDQLRHGQHPTAGYGHPIYRHHDPRARLLLPLARSAATLRARRTLADLTTAGDDTNPPNVDLVLAMLTTSTRMIPGAAEAIFAIARTAGWLAHATEEYRSPSRFRPRASYTGPRP